VTNKGRKQKNTNAQKRSIKSIEMIETRQFVLPYIIELKDSWLVRPDHNWVPMVNKHSATVLGSDISIIKVEVPYSALRSK